MLVWDDHARSGHYFFSWDSGFVYTGAKPEAPPEWIKWALDNSSVDLSGDDLRWTVGLDENVVKNDEPTEQGWLKLTFTDGTVVGLSQTALSKTDEPLAQSIATVSYTHLRAHET